MRWLWACVVCLSVGSIVCPPVTKPPPAKPKAPGGDKNMEDDVVGVGSCVAPFTNMDYL